MRRKSARHMQRIRSSLPAIALMGLSLPAMAICVETPIEQELKAADTVFVATITESRLVDAPGDLKNRQKQRIRHSFVVRERLKGDPASIAHVYTMGLYNDPLIGSNWRWAEQTRLIPGESVLVVGDGSGEAEVSLCSPSKRMTEVELEEIRLLLSTK